uniref:Polyphenol oxidase, chloroplastic-like n=1 Tax=Tanacetum cinerariifolium TaxID=118510 RepID=A0A6L2M011_TANCI|nr:polyphenol oxidase, chloroplastic-like [Tanacetum cinerariifolium]
MAGSSTIPVSFPITLDKPTTVVVVRPPRNEREEDEQEEVLVIEGSDAEEKTEFAGSFVKVPHKQRQDGGEKLITTKLRLGISELLEGLGVEDDDENILVKLVPKCDNVHIKIGGIRIEIE